MALDGIYLHHIKNEIESFAIGSRVEKIHQPSKDELILTLRSKDGAKKLLMSCRADSARVHFTSYAPENPSKPPMLCMLFRKHLIGAKVSSVVQDGLERILKINLDATNEIGDPVKFSIIIEIMGRYSNIILVNGKSKIIDALKRVDETKSQVRTIMPGDTYVSPPKQDKLNIFDDDINVIKEKLNNSTQKPSKAFQNIVMGVSPIVCREYENGVSLEEIKEYALNPKPQIVVTDKPLDFAFMPIKQYDSLVTTKDYDSVCELLDFFFYEKSRKDRIKNRAGELFKTLNSLEEKAIRKAINRKTELEACKGKEQLKEFGDLIATNQYALKKGSPYYDLENYYDNNNIVRIPADVSLNPSQNAQKYYKEYRKKQVAETKLYDFIKEAEDEAKYFDSVIDSLKRAQTDSEISAIRLELASLGYLKERKNKNSKNPKALAPMQFESSEGFKIFVGRNNVMNDKLTLKTAKNYDLWFHVKDSAGSHVVVQNDGREFTDKLIREAAILASYYSSASESSNVAVDYTIIKNVKKPSGAKPGMVIYVDYKTEYVTPNLEEVERINKIV